MQPTAEQLTSIRNSVGLSLKKRSLELSEDITWRTIEKWEAIRPKDDDISEISRLHAEIAELKDSKAMLERSRDARIAICDDLAGRVAELTEERDRLKAMLPEWIPVSDREKGRPVASNDGFLVYLSDTGETWCGPYDYDGSDPETNYFLSASTLANLPKRNPAPKPTAEEIMRQEFEDKFKPLSTERHPDGGYANTFAQTAWMAWKCAKGGSAS